MLPLQSILMEPLHTLVDPPPPRLLYRRPVQRATGRCQSLRRRVSRPEIWLRFGRSGKSLSRGKSITVASTAGSATDVSTPKTTRR